MYFDYLIIHFLHACLLFCFFFHMDAIAKGIFLLFNVHLIQCLMPITLTLWEGLQITINNGVGRGGKFLTETVMLS